MTTPSKLKQNLKLTGIQPSKPLNCKLKPKTAESKITTDKNLQR